MADIKISELAQVSALNNGDLVEVSQVNALAPSGYTSLKASMTDLGKKVNSDIEYTTDLADFTDKTTLGAIKETAKGKNIADEYDDTQTYDKGDVVIYKNTLYICNTNNTTGAWDATKWTATTVQSLIGSLSQLTTSNKSSLVGAVNEVNNGKSNKILVERKTAQVTMDNYYKSATISLSKTGYAAIGIVGYQTNTVGVVCFRNNIEGTNAIVGLVNRDGTTALGTNVDLYIDVLYLKNTTT